MERGKEDLFPHPSPCEPQEKGLTHRDKSLLNVHDPTRTERCFSVDDPILPPPLERTEQ